MKETIRTRKHGVATAAVVVGVAGGAGGAVLSLETVVLVLVPFCVVRSHSVSVCRLSVVCLLSVVQSLTSRQSVCSHVALKGALAKY